MIGRYARVVATFANKPFKQSFRKTPITSCKFSQKKLNIEKNILKRAEELRSDLKR